MTIESVLKQYADVADILAQHKVLILYAQVLSSAQIDPQALSRYLSLHFTPGRFPHPPGELIERIRGKPLELDADARADEAAFDLIRSVSVNTFAEAKPNLSKLAIRVIERHYKGNFTEFKRLMSEGHQTEKERFYFLVRLAKVVWNDEREEVKLPPFEPSAFLGQTEEEPVDPEVAAANLAAIKALLGGKGKQV